MNLDKIKERIRRALALAGDPCNPNESAMAAALAARLMSQYRIDEDSLLSESQTRNIKISSHLILESGERIQKWVWPIIRQLSSMNQCHAYISGPRWFVLGDENGANVIRYLLELILSQVNDLADREWEKYNNACVILEDDTVVFFNSGISGKSWKHSFRLGCASEIGNRLYLLHRETRKKLESGGVTESGGSFSNALAVINTKEALVQKAVEAAGFKKAAGTVNNHRDAYNQGRRSAHKVNIGASARGALRELV